MAELQVSRKTIRELLENEKSIFLVPEYQRPYSWKEDECKTLWEDLFSFAFPDNDYSKFDKCKDEYFLGPIVTFLNTSKQIEIIDGQQRLTSLLLLLRVFYNRYQKMQDPKTQTTRGIIGRCIWKTDELGNLVTGADSLKIDSKVITDKDKDDLLNILNTGNINEKSSSNYVKNYRFFQERIDQLLKDFPDYFSYLSARILNNCVMLPIETESQDKAMYIFSTLNDRGLQLSDSDIFKSKLYKYFSFKAENFSKTPKEKEQFIKNEFTAKWKMLEEVSNQIFRPLSGNPMDELFIRYMYYERAKRGIKDTTTIALRKFYENPDKKSFEDQNNSSNGINASKYSLLNEHTFANLITLTNFWKDVYALNNTRFSPDVLRKLFVLKYAPNTLWTGITSVYFMANKDADGQLEDAQFCEFLEKITAFILAYAVVRPGVNVLRTPIYEEMVKLTEGKKADFARFKLDIENTREMFRNFGFYNLKPITKSLLYWWTFYNENQEFPTKNSKYQIEHIFANNRPSDTLSEKDRESLGNKILLEQQINIRASDFRFCDKKLYYLGKYKGKNGKLSPKTQINELAVLANTKDDFTEQDILERNEKIINGFMNFLQKNELAK